jgi:hypothetical protein
MTFNELQEQYLKEGLAFLDRQMLIAPSVNEQIGFDFQGLRRSYADSPSHPDARFVARFGRIWIYDVALSIYADLKAGRIRQAGYQVGRVMQLGLREEERGFKGLWHFSYNTQGDLFIDPRGPTGANAWCLNAIYAYILASGNATALSWANRMVRGVLFDQQVMEPADPRCGLIRAGRYNAEDTARREAMGYRVFEGDFNCRYEHVILEHNADCAGTFRLAFRATKRFTPDEKSFLGDLIDRHGLLMKGMRRGFWQGDHFVSAMDPEGKFYRGTDGFPSIAVDNNTWAAHIFLPYDKELARAAIRYVEERFVTHAPPAKIEDVREGALPTEDLKGLFYFPATFADPFVLVADKDRAKMEKLLHPEAAFGFLLFLKDAGMETRALEFYEETLKLQHLYGPSGAPYASANVPAIFSTLHSVTTAASGIVATKILQGAAGDDFIGVLPPAEFVVDGKPPS